MRDLAANPVFADPEWHDLGRDQVRTFFKMCFWGSFFEKGWWRCI